LKYGNIELCKFMKRDTGKVETARIRFLQPSLGTAIRDHKRNTDTRGELSVSNIISVTEDQ
jgi:hypothetical protein